MEGGSIRRVGACLLLVAVAKASGMFGMDATENQRIATKHFQQAMVEASANWRA